MAESQQPLAYDLFVSYSHQDDEDGWVAALIQAIGEEHARFTPVPLRIFFDREEIPTMADWEHRILGGLRSSRLMLAVLSPDYFVSRYCHTEWEVYSEHELERALPGEGIAPVYAIAVPAFEEAGRRTSDAWMTNLHHRQYLDLREWRREGPHGLRHEGARRRLALLEQRLAERLRAAERITASPTTVPPHNRNFVGRAEELRRLRSMLALGRVGAITAVHGIGGIGKSAMAFEYAHAYAGEYPGGRFLLPAAGTKDLRVVIVGLAEYKGITLTDQERRDPDAAFARVRAAFEQGPRSLLILDNVDDPAFLAPSERARCLPAGDSVHILVTTRLEPERLPGLECLPLDTLSEAEAVRLLAKHRPFADHAEAQAAWAIARRLGGHPLAVEVVGVFLWQNPEVNYGGYLARLEREGLGALEGAGRDDRVALSRHRQKLLRELMEPTLVSLAPGEVVVLEHAALLPSDQIALPWLRSLVGHRHPEFTAEPEPGYPDPWRQLERRLFGLRLLSPSEDQRFARMHRLVQDVVVARMQAERQEAARQQTAIFAKKRADFLSHSWINPGNHWELDPLLTYTERAITGDNVSESNLTLASTVQQVLWRLDRLGEARTLIRHAIAARRKMAQVDELSLARDYSNLASLEFAFFDFERARNLLKHAIAIEEIKLGQSHPTLAIRYFNLGCAEIELDNNNEGSRLIRKAVDIYDKNGAVDENLVDFYTGLAWAEYKKGNHIEAKRIMGNTLELGRKVYDSNHPRFLMLYAHLGRLEQRTGNLKRAKSIFQEVLPKLENAFPDSAYLLTIYGYLLNLAAELGEFQTARDLLNRMAAICGKAFAGNEAAIAQQYLSMCQIARRLGDLEKARDFAQRTLEAVTGLTSYPQLDVVQAYALSAVVGRDLGNTNEARAHIQHALESVAKVPSSNTDLAIVYSNLALAARDVMEPSEVQELFRRSVDLAHAHLQTQQDTVTAQVYSNLGLVARDIGDHAIARQMLRRAISMLEAKRDTDHDMLALARYRLGLVEHDLGRAQDARELMHQAYHVQLPKLGADHSDTRNTERWLAENDPGALKEIIAAKRCRAGKGA